MKPIFSDYGSIMEPASIQKTTFPFHSWERENKFRIITNPYAYWAHDFDTQKVKCSDPAFYYKWKKELETVGKAAVSKIAQSSCFHCRKMADGSSSSFIFEPREFRYAAACFWEQNEVRILDFTPSTYQNMRHFIREHGDPTNYNLVAIYSDDYLDLKLSNEIESLAARKAIANFNSSGGKEYLQALCAPPKSQNEPGMIGPYQEIKNPCQEINLTPKNKPLQEVREEIKKIAKDKPLDISYGFPHISHHDRDGIESTASLVATILSHCNEKNNLENYEIKILKNRGSQAEHDLEFDVQMLDGIFKKEEKREMIKPLEAKQTVLQDICKEPMMDKKTALNYYQKYLSLESRKESLQSYNIAPGTLQEFPNTNCKMINSDLEDVERFLRSQNGEKVSGYQRVTNLNQAKAHLADLSVKIENFRPQNHIMSRWQKQTLQRMHDLADQLGLGV